MQDDLHRGRRRRVRLQHVAVCLAIAFGCARTNGAPEDAAPPAPGDGALQDRAQRADAGADPAAQLLQGLGRDGRAAAEQLVAHCDDRQAYLDVRRRAAASLSAWRRWIGIPAEAAFGPEVAIQEAGGSIGALDRAMTGHDCNAVRDAAGNLEAAFRIPETAVDRIGITRTAFGQAVSDATYRLGQAVLESTPYVPEGDDAAFADAMGFLDFIDAGTRALGLDVPSQAAPLERLRSARTLAEVTDRAGIVRAAGALGASIRRGLRATGIATTLMYRPLRDAPDIDALTLPRPALPADAPKAALGKQLFFDRRLSPRGARACATCHEPGRAYADGLVAPASLDPATTLRRNTPSLLYAPVEALLTWDGRVRMADRQALMVLHTRAEMGSTDEQLAQVVASDPAYAAAFRASFADGVTPANIGIALASFEASDLVPGSAPIDRFARGDEDALSPDDRAGLDVFAGKGRCARCHVPPVFSGSRPPDFTAPVFAVLGVPSAPDAKALDGDRGRGGGDFRVPTVRNIGQTAPYFHNGRYATLDRVVDFYDKGGGRGLGLDVPNQDPEIRPLHLTSEEKRVLLVFLREALTDAN
ncbi:MAG TPA: cytochrome c peroxidase [Polyangiaceae bacterium]|nr:cytochrome c peroxidase [Polyangiaceae bacterium]